MWTGFSVRLRGPLRMALTALFSGKPKPGAFSA